MKRLFLIGLIMFMSMTLGLSQTRTYRGDLSVYGASSLNDEFGAGIGVRTTHGIALKNDAFLGAGLGFVYNFGGFYIPVYVQAKQSFNIESDLKPYAALSVGALFDDCPSVAPYFAPEIGLSYKNLGLFAMVSFSNFASNYVYHDPGCYTTFDCRKVRMLSAGISYSFGARK